MNFALHPQEQAAIRKNPFPLAALQTQPEDIEATAHPTGNGALIALQFMGSPGATAVPKEKIEAGEIILGDHGRGLIFNQFSGSAVMPHLGKTAPVENSSR
jgi:hypothetical protein